jgi:hypothetical protein
VNLGPIGDPLEPPPPGAAAGRTCPAWAIPIFAPAVLAEEWIMSDLDLTRLLREWPHEPGKVNARRITGADGHPKIQVRLELGLLQLEVEGRPDGARPEGFPSLCDLHEDRLKRYTRSTGIPAGFVLTEEECRGLREEAVQIYHRYVALFALAEHVRVCADTEHSLRIFDLCRDHAASENDRAVLEQFRAHVMTMRTRAEAEIALAAERPKAALAVIDRGLAEIRSLMTEQGLANDFDRSNDVQLLRGMRDALIPKLPASQRVELEERLRVALDTENYELAAILRDELRLLDR